MMLLVFVAQTDVHCVIVIIDGDHMLMDGEDVLYFSIQRIKDGQVEF